MKKDDDPEFNKARYLEIIKGGKPPKDFPKYKTGCCPCSKKVMDPDEVAKELKECRKLVDQYEKRATGEISSAEYKAIFSGKVFVLFDDP